jgi:hypothetical protein
MSDWQDATDPTQPAREREQARYVRARAHWQKRQIEQGRAVGKMAMPEAVEPDHDEGA